MRVFNILDIHGVSRLICALGERGVHLLSNYIKLGAALFYCNYRFHPLDKDKMADNAWQTYADQVLNRFDYDTNDWAITGVCSGAAIYGHDGSLWANAGEEGGNLA